jgi:hypothetical protein
MHLKVLMTKYYNLGPGASFVEYKNVQERVLAGP